jgi:pyruvate/2-oxoglutarate dehydrogenase complex dihydrolipoamide acyltransferase (E2) component
MIEVIMPKVDMAMTEGTIALWRYRAGEIVRAGEPLFDITTDKADVEVEAPASGTLWDVRAAAGQTIPIGQPVAFILAPGEQPPIARDHIVQPFTNVQGGRTAQHEEERRDQRLVAAAMPVGRKRDGVDTEPYQRPRDQCACSSAPRHRD